MSAQNELDQRTAEVKEILGWAEALFPSLFVHGLHITAQDMTLFNKQYNLMSSMIGDLSEENQAIGLKILHWFHHNYPHREQRRPPPQRVSRHIVQSPVVQVLRRREVVARRTREQSQGEHLRELLMRAVKLARSNQHLP